MRPRSPRYHITLARHNPERLLEYTYMYGVRHSYSFKHSTALFLLCKPGPSNPRRKPSESFLPDRSINRDQITSKLSSRKKGQIFQTSRESQYSWQTFWPTSWARSLPRVPRQLSWWRPTQPSPLSSSVYLRFYSSPIAYTLPFYRSYAQLYGGLSIGS